VTSADDVTDPEPASGEPDEIAEDPFDATWRERLLVLGISACAFVTALVFGLIYANDSTLELLGIVPASMFAVGKFLPLWGITGESNFQPWELGLVIGVLDTYTVLFAVYALEGVYRFRRIKVWLDKIQANAQLVLTAYPWIRKASIGGVIAFVLFPVAGTGALAGAFLGIMLGLHRHVLIAAVSFGGFLGGMTMAFLATYFGGALIEFRDAQQNPVVKYATIAVVVIALLLAFRWLNNAYKRAINLAREQQQSG
jgi:uncharacterized membrane protein